MLPASLSKRFFAAIIDSVALSLLLGIFYKIVSSVFDNPFLILGGMLLGNILILKLYLFNALKGSGQTFGKRTLGIQVVHDVELTTWKIFLREFIGKNISALLFMLGFLLPLFNKEGKALHDYLAGTQVLSVEDLEGNEGSWAKKIAMGFAAMIALAAMGVGALLFTPLPLPALREQMEAAGVQMQSLSGSIAGGLHIENLSIIDEAGNFKLQSADLKLDLFALFSSHFHIENIAADQGALEIIKIPSQSRPQKIHENSNQSSKQRRNINEKLKFSLDSMSIKNFVVKVPGRETFVLKEISISELQASIKGAELGKMRFESLGVLVEAQRISYIANTKKFHAESVSGEMRPQLVALLKQPLDFQLQISGDLQNNVFRLSGRALKNQISGEWSSQRKSLHIQKVPLLDYVHSKLPIENLNISLIMKPDVPFGMDAELDLCGVRFRYLQGALRPQAGSSRVQLDPVPKFMVAMFGGKLKSPLETGALLEDYISLQLRPAVGVTSYVSANEIASDVCFQKSSVMLSPEQQAKIALIVPIVSFSDQGGSGLLAAQTLLQPSQQSPSQVIRDPASVDPGAVESLEQFRQRVVTARGLFARGNIKEAAALLESKGPPVHATQDEQISMQRLLGWMYLYGGRPEDAKDVFTVLFHKNKDISDAEGLKRVADLSGDTKASQSWGVYIKDSVRLKPELKLKLTTKMQKEIGL